MLDCKMGAVFCFLEIILTAQEAFYAFIRESTVER